MAVAKVVELVTAAQELKQSMADPSATDLRTQAGRVACDAYASAPSAVEVAFSTSGVQGGVAARAALDDMCGPYWGQQGTDPPVVEGPLFEGGQCPCSDYDIRWEVYNNGNLNSVVNQTRKGPINITVATRPDGGPRVTIEYGDGVGCTAGSTSPTNIAANPGDDWTIENITVNVVSGPDNCGSLPTVISPGPNNPGTPFGSPQSRPVGGTPFDFTPDTVSDPQGGGPGIRIDSPFGPITIDPLGGGDRSPLVPQEGDDVAGGQPSGEQDAPEEGEAIGYSWRFTNIPLNRGGVAAKEPKVFPELIGTIQLRLTLQGGGVYYMSQHVVREERGAVFRPAEGVRVSGVSWSFKTHFGPVEIRPIVLPTEV